MPMSSIGQRIRERRKAVGFSRQADVAKLIGVDQSTFSDMERGSGFGADVLMTLCGVLKTTPEYIMRGVSADVGEDEVLAVYRSLKPEGRTAMLAMARGLAMAQPQPATVPRSGELSNSGEESNPSKRAA